MAARLVFQLFSIPVPEIGGGLVRRLEKREKGVVGRRYVVLLGARNELESLSERDLLAFFGASEIHQAQRCQQN